MEYPHQSHRDSRSRRNRHPPLRREPLRRQDALPCFLSAPCRKSRWLNSRRRLRRRLPGHSDKAVAAGSSSHPDRIEPEEGHLPPRDRARAYIDEHRYTICPRRNSSRETVRHGHATRCRALRNNPSGSCQPGSPRRSSGLTDRIRSTNSSPGSASRHDLAATVSDTGIHFKNFVDRLTIPEPTWLTEW